MSAVQSSLREFIELERSTSLRERFESLNEDDATALLVERYGAFREEGGPVRTLRHESTHGP